MPSVGQADRGTETCRWPCTQEKSSDTASWWQPGAAAATRPGGWLQSRAAQRAKRRSKAMRARCASPGGTIGRRSASSAVMAEWGASAFTAVIPGRCRCRAARGPMPRAAHAVDRDGGRLVVPIRRTGCGTEGSSRKAKGVRATSLSGSTAGSIGTVTDHDWKAGSAWAHSHAMRCTVSCSQAGASAAAGRAGAGSRRGPGSGILPPLPGCVAVLASAGGRGRRHRVGGRRARGHRRGIRCRTGGRRTCLGPGLAGAVVRSRGGDGRQACFPGPRHAEGGWKVWRVDGEGGGGQGGRGGRWRIAVRAGRGIGRGPRRRRCGRKRVPRVPRVARERTAPGREKAGGRRDVFGRIAQQVALEPERGAGRGRQGARGRAAAAGQALAQWREVALHGVPAMQRGRSAAARSGCPAPGRSTRAASRCVLRSFS